MRGIHVVAGLVLERGRLLLERNGRLEHIDVRPPAPPRAPASQPPGIAVRSVADDSYAIRRADLEHAIANAHRLALDARFTPAFRGGKPVGFAIHAIRPGSVYSQLGLQNGDVVRRINGLDATNVDNLLQIYSRLRGWTHIDIDIDRAGSSVRKTFRIE